MATYFPSVKDQRDAILAPYLQDQKSVPSPDPSCLPDNMIYMNQASAEPYMELLYGSSLSGQERQIPSAGCGDELEFIPPTGGPVNLQSDFVQLQITSCPLGDNSVCGDSHMVSRASLRVLEREQSLLSQGLSLSLGTQMHSAIQVSSYHSPYTSPSPCFQMQGQDASQNKELRSGEYLSFDLPRGICNTGKEGSLSRPYCFIDQTGGHSGPQLYESSNVANATLNSKYLKPAQELLDEVVSVWEALKQTESAKCHDFNKPGLESSGEIDTKSSNCTKLPSMRETSSDPQEPTTSSSPKLSPSERQELQDKVTKLLTLLEELDGRYRQYHHQMQLLASSFETLAGYGAAKPYTTLALRTISRQFRCLRDAINSQIQAIQRSLGEEETTPSGQGRLSRLRYVDLQLRQQKALQQFGIIRHSWRPQRGLPESSVSILRAWLFEHFLHPYPKDSEKIMLARQTGLTRGQVANWFINARVRLWKPMVEEMYKEEFGEADSKTSPEQTDKSAGDFPCPAEDRQEELLGNLASKTTDEALLAQLNDSRGLPGCAAKRGCLKGDYGEDDPDYGVMKLQNSQNSNVDGQNLLAEGSRLSNQARDAGSFVAAATYNIGEFGSLMVENQVSLALGLQHCERDVLPVSGRMQFEGDYMAASSMGHDTGDYGCMDTLNQQNRIGANQDFRHDTWPSTLSSKTI